MTGNNITFVIPLHLILNQFIINMVKIKHIAQIEKQCFNLPYN